MSVDQPPSPSNPPDDETSPRSLPRHIGLIGAILLVIGNVIGSGIFLVSNDVAAQSGSTIAFMGAWIAGGVIALLGALIYAELGAMMPQSGGLYVFLREAFGRNTAFLFGWACLVAILTGQAASIAIGFAKYTSRIWPQLGVENILFAIAPVSVSAGQLVAAILLGGIALVNYLGVRSGNLLSASMTIIKVVGLAVLPVLILIQVGDSRPIDWNETSQPLAAIPFSLAMIGVLYAYEGWHYAAFAAGEIKNPQRVVPQAMLIGTTILTVIYCLVNLSYVQALGYDGVAASQRVGEEAAGALMGRPGSLAMTVLAVVSTLGCTAATFFVSIRVFYAMSRDGLFFARVSELHPRYGTPHVAVLLMAAVSMILALTGSYSQLVAYATLSALLFSILGAVAVIRLRISRPDLPRPYRCWGYPVTPCVFIGSLLLLLGSTAIEQPWESAAGLALIAIGIPVGRRWLKS